MAFWRLLIKAFIFQVAFDPLEEELSLPAFFVDMPDRFGS